MGSRYYSRGAHLSVVAADTYKRQYTKGNINSHTLWKTITSKHDEDTVTNISKCEQTASRDYTQTFIHANTKLSLFPSTAVTITLQNKHTHTWFSRLNPVHFGHLSFVFFMYRIVHLCPGLSPSSICLGEVEWRARRHDWLTRAVGLRASSSTSGLRNAAWVRGKLFCTGFCMYY